MKGIAREQPPVTRAQHPAETIIVIYVNISIYLQDLAYFKLTYHLLFSYVIYDHEEQNVSYHTAEIYIHHIRVNMYFARFGLRKVHSIIRIQFESVWKILDWIHWSYWLQSSWLALCYLREVKDTVPIGGWDAMTWL